MLSLDDPARAAHDRQAAAQLAVRASVPMWFLMLTAILGGALVMVLEVIGSRVIGPFFGVSLFVWTSLISVTLIALSVGYALGGALADRYPTADALYALLAIAGVLTGIVPWIKGPVLEATMPLGLRGGTFSSTLLLFGPPMVALGCVSPYVVRLSVQEMERIGRTVGSFYALSTLGSVAGTLATGFVLIAWLGVDGILSLVAGSLLALSSVYFLAFRRRVWAPLVMLPALLWLGPSAPSVAHMPDGTRVEQLAAHHSYYGNLKVLEYSYGSRRSRELIIDGLVQGGVDPATGQSVYPYPYVAGILLRALHPTGRSALVIGLGAGTIPTWLEARGVRTDAVDIDPVVVDLARRYFDYRPSGEVHVADARRFLRATGRKYDYLVLDVFTGDTTPSHLMSVEALGLMAQRLHPDGVLSMNLIGALGGSSALVGASVVRTLERVFDTVEIVPLFDPGDEDPSGNLVVLAYRGPERSGRAAAEKPGEVHPLARAEVETSLARRWRYPADQPALVLNDDYNPVDFYDAELREALRMHILATTRPEFLVDDR